MKRLAKFLVGTAASMLLILPQSCSSVFTASPNRQAEMKMAGRSRTVRESPKVKKAKKIAAKKEEKRKKDWARAVRETKKLHYERQSDEVKERLKMNERDTELRHKERARQIKKDSRNRAKKFR